MNESTQKIKEKAKAKATTTQDSHIEKPEFILTEEGTKHIIKVVKEDILKQENKTLKEKIASGLIVMSILGGVLAGLLALAASFYVSYSALQREFLQTKIEQQNERIKIEQQNERIKKLEQNQNPFLQLIR